MVPEQGSSKTVVWKATPKQDDFIQKALGSKYNYLLFGGAVRGGKTAALCGLAVLFAKLYPKSRWAVIRADLPRLLDTTMVSFMKLIEPMYAPGGFITKINRSKWDFDCSNGSRIMFRTESIKDDPELEKFNGFEVNGFLCDEINELKEATWVKMLQRAGAWIVPGGGVQPNPKIIGTCNPDNNWVKRKWYTPWENGKLKAPYWYQPALIDDNPYIPESYKESLKEMPPKAYERFVQGSWEVNDEPDQLIPWATIDDCYLPRPITKCICGHLETDHLMADARRDGKRHCEPCKGRKGQCMDYRPDRQPAMGVDVAEMGDDLFCWAIGHGCNLTDLYTSDEKEMYINEETTISLVTHFSIPANRIGIDGVGVGAGVISHMKKEGYKIKRIIGGARTLRGQYDKIFSFKNLRTQMYWALREEMRAGEIGGIQGENLKEELAAQRYKIKGDKEIELISKDIISKDLGRSPDEADGVVYWNWMRKPRKSKIRATIL